VTANKVAKGLIKSFLQAMKHKGHRMHNHPFGNFAGSIVHD